MGNIRICAVVGVKMTLNKQRKGQFLWNYMNPKESDVDMTTANILVGLKLWNVSDTEFDKIMKAWSEQK